MEVFLIGSSLLAIGMSGIYASYQKKGEHLRRNILVLWHIGAIAISAAVLLLMTYTLLGCFQFTIIYEHSSVDLPKLYRLAALWASPGGSFLIWAFIAIMMGYWVIDLGKEAYERSFPIYAYLTVILLGICLWLNPFRRLPTIPIDGLGLELGLQDSWMVIHPIFIFMGYTAMAVVMIIGTTLSNERLLKDWMKVSLLFLGIGIMTGSMWSYRALGRGSYWLWDSAENMSLVPWLLLCAYVHSKEKVTAYKSSLPFGIAMLGIFLIRSGLLKVQSTYTEEGLSGILLVLLILVGPVTLGYCVYKSYQILKGKTSHEPLATFSKMTYSYALIILGLTLLPLGFKETISSSIYNGLTLIYISLSSLLLLKLHKQNFRLKRTAILSLSVGIAVLIAKCFDYEKLGLLFVLWFVLMPLVGYLLTYRQWKKPYYYWTHMLVLIMLVGGITSAGMGNEFVELMEPPKASEMIQPNHNTIKRKWLEDDLVERTDYDEVTSETMVYYKTKPLIQLFWIGSFGVLVVIGSSLIMPRLKKH